MSGSCLDEFPGNTACSFKNRFPYEISVHPQTYVSLSEISFQQHMSQQHLDTPKLKIFDFLHETEVALPAGSTVTTYGKWYNLELPLKCFSNAEQLCACLNLLIYDSIARLKTIRAPIFDYDSTMKRVWVSIKESYYVLIVLEGAILPLLGIEMQSQESALQYLAIGRSKRERAYRYNGKIRYYGKDNRQIYEAVESENEFCKLQPQIFTLDDMIITTNIVSESIVGDKTLNLLRFVALKRKADGKHVTVNYASSRNYIPLKNHTFSEISVKIVDRTNKLVNLIGNTRIELHFSQV